MIETDLVFSIIQTLGVLIGVAIAVYELMNMRKTRKMELLTQLSTNWTSLEFMRNSLDVRFQQNFSNVKEWMEKYSPRVNPEAASKMNSVLNSFNNVGNLVKNNVVELDFVWESLPPVVIIGLWEKVKPVIEATRSMYNDPMFYKSLEYLYDETKKKHPDVLQMGAESIRERWLSEQRKK